MVKDTTTSTSTTTSSCPYFKPSKAEQGWECPRCKKINAPWIRQCNCSGTDWTITTDWTYKPEWWKDYVYCQQGDNITTNPNIYQVGGSDYWNPTTKTWENVRSTQTNASYYTSPTGGTSQQKE